MDTASLLRLGLLIRRTSGLDVFRTAVLTDSQYNEACMDEPPMCRGQEMNTGPYARSPLKGFYMQQPRPSGPNRVSEKTADQARERRYPLLTEVQLTCR